VPAHLFAYSIDEGIESILIKFGFHAILSKLRPILLLFLIIIPQYLFFVVLKLKGLEISQKKNISYETLYRFKMYTFLQIFFDKTDKNKNT
jgi:hypothetical protein